MSELLTNTCILGFSDFLMASHAESTSDGTHRARAAIFGPFINFEISLPARLTHQAGTEYYQNT